MSAIKSNGSSPESSPEARDWAECIGWLIMSFGACEYLVLQWLEKFEGAGKALKILKKKGNTLDDNIRIIQNHIRSCCLSDDDKRIAAKAWSGVYVLKAMRNRLAHNPLAVIKDRKGNRMLRVIEMKKITISRWMRFDTIVPQDILDASFSLSEIKKTLTILLAKLP
jgi:hypothetical protein